MITLVAIIHDQNVNVPHRTVLDNTGLAQSVRGETKQGYVKDALKWLERVGLGGQGGQYPHQLS